MGAWGLGYATRDLRSASPEDVERRTLAFATYTTPYVECAGWVGEDQHIEEARERIEQYIAAEWERDHGMEVAVYARDLTDGAWIGIGHDEKFMAASLLKVPVLFYQLSVLEDDPAYLDGKLVFPGAEHMPSPDNTQALPSEQRLVAGTAYTRRDLLERMLSYSDNHAKDLLMEGVPWSAVGTLMTALNIDIDYSTGEPRISARELATLFRILYPSPHGNPQSCRSKYRRPFPVAPHCTHVGMNRVVMPPRGNVPARCPGFALVSTPHSIGSRMCWKYDGIGTGRTLPTAASAGSNGRSASRLRSREGQGY